MHFIPSMLHHRLFKYIIFSIIFFSSSCFANTDSSKTHILGFGKIEGFIESKDRGVGVELLDEIIKRLDKKGHHIELRFQPFKRIIKNFINKDIDIAFPIINGGTFIKAGYDKWGFKEMPAHSIPMFTSGGFTIYSKNTNPLYHDISSLFGKNVGVIRGAYIPSAIKNSKEIFLNEVNNGKQSFAMLSKNRIDAFLVQKFWAQGILEQNKFKGFHHGNEFETIIGSFIFQQNQEGLDLLAEFNYVIATMILDGTYKEISNKYPNNKMVIPYGK